MNRTDWLWAFFISVLFIFINGYSFNTDDQAEHLPQVYQMLDSELYPHDYFVNTSNANFTIRYYYEWLALVVEGTVGLRWGFFILTLICLTLTAYSLMRVALLWLGEEWAGRLAPVMVMLVFYRFTIGANHIGYGGLISGTLAVALTSTSIPLFLNRRHLASGILLGAATLFQPLVGLQIWILLAGYTILSSERSDWKPTLYLLLGYIPVAAIILVPILKRQFGPTEPHDPDLYYHLLYAFRNHHHYLPSLFPITHYVKSVGLLTLAIGSYVFLRPKDRGFFGIFSTTAILGMLIYWLAVEHLGLSVIGKTQWFKTSVWVGAFGAILVGGVISRLLESVVPAYMIRKKLAYAVSAGSVLLLLLITNSAYLPEGHGQRYMIGNRTLSDLELMHGWIEANTAKDAVVLVSPDDNGFSCQAKRSMPIHYQAIVHEPFFMLPWYEDYREIYGVGIENLQGIDARRHAAELYGTRNYRGGRKHIDLRLDNLETCEFADELGPLLHRRGKWVLTAFIPQ